MCIEVVMTIDLHLICLTIIMALDHLSSMVYILSILMPYSFYEDLRCVWLLGHFHDVVFEILVELQIVLSLNIKLVEDNYA